MSTNLVQAIMQMLPPEAVTKIASSLGVDQTAAQKGISAGIPGILAGFVNAASTPGGAQKLGSAVSQFEGVPGEDIVKKLLDSSHGNLAESGAQMLSGTAGGGYIQSLTSIIAQFSGLGQGSAKSLLGMLGTVVLAFLRREQVSGALDSKGLASLLVSQKDNIDRAMPPGLASRLPDSNIRPAAPPALSRAPANSARTSSRNWVSWLLPALIIAGAAIYLLPIQEQNRTAQDINSGTTTVAKTKTALPASQEPAPVTTASAEAEPSAQAVENGIVANIARLRASLQTIKDPATAKAALGEIKEISAQLGRLKAMAQQLSPEARKAIAGAVANRVPDLDGLIDRLGSQTDFGGEARPAMDSLKSQLVGITKA